MNIPKAARAMAYLDEGLISDAAEEAAPVKKRVRAWWLVAAACLCLALGGTALAGALKLVRIRDLNNGTHYSVEAQMEQLPVSAFTGPMMRELPEVFIRQYAEDALYTPDPKDPFRNEFRPSPSVVYMDFPTIREAADYVGLDALTVPDWDFWQKNVWLTVQGEANGDIYAISLAADYQTRGVKLKTWAEVYTEHFDLASVNITWGAGYSGISNSESSFTESHYTGANGSDCVIITLDVPSEETLYADCYLVNNGIFYQLHLSYPEDNTTYAETLMRQWADMFP